MAEVTDNMPDLVDVVDRIRVERDFPPMCAEHGVFRHPDGTLDAAMCLNPISRRLAWIEADGICEDQFLCASHASKMMMQEQEVGDIRIVIMERIER